MGSWYQIAFGFVCTPIAKKQAFSGTIEKLKVQSFYLMGTYKCLSLNKEMKLLARTAQDVNSVLQMQGERGGQRDKGSNFFKKRLHNSSLNLLYKETKYFHGIYSVKQLRAPH